MMLKSLSKDKVASRRERLVNDLEGIGDILSFEARRNKNENVISGLKRLQEIVKSLFEVEERDPEEFQKLLLAQEFFDRYQKDKKEAEFSLAFDPDKYLITFSTAINQIIRIHNVAIDAKNTEASRFATYHLVWLLDDFARHDGREIFIEQLLRNLALVSRTAIKSEDISMYSAAVHWYPDIVFSGKFKEGPDFKLKYLDTFDKYFFATAKYLVSEGQSKLFKELVKHLIDGQLPSSFTNIDIQTYAYTLSDIDFSLYQSAERDHHINSLVRELSDSISSLDSRESLDAWLQRFTELKVIVESYLTPEQRVSLEGKEKEVRNAAVDRYKYNNLLEIIFSIGAFCLFVPEREDYIKYLWEYKQPEDSDAAWIGQDITPNTFKSVVEFYFRKSLFQRNDFWEDHHGTNKYYKDYFLVLLARTLRKVGQNSAELTSYDLPALSINRLSDIDYSIDGLITTANALKLQKDRLVKLGFPENAGEVVFDGILIPFLVSLKEKAKKRIEKIHQEKPISETQVAKFKSEVLEGYKKYPKLRDVLVHYGLYEGHMDDGSYVQGNNAWGINTLEDKAVFFDEWNVHFGAWGSDYGSNIARGENSRLLKALLGEEVRPTSVDIDEVLSAQSDVENLVIVATNGTVFSLFQNKTSFSPKWSNITPINIPSFEGYYEYNGVSIPVFQIVTDSSDDNQKSFVFNIKKLGKLKQYSPLQSADQSASQIEYFYMNVESLSDELIVKYLAEPPQWLAEVGNATAQREHLLKRAIVKILERFEFVRDDDFQVFLLKVD